MQGHLRTDLMSVHIVTNVKTRTRRGQHQADRDQTMADMYMCFRTFLSMTDGCRNSRSRSYLLATQGTFWNSNCRAVLWRAPPQSALIAAWTCSLNSRILRRGIPSILKLRVSVPSANPASINLLSAWRGRTHTRRVCGPAAASTRS